MQELLATVSLAFPDGEADVYLMEGKRLSGGGQTLALWWVRTAICLFRCNLCVLFRLFRRNIVTLRINRELYKTLQI